MSLLSKPAKLRFQNMLHPDIHAAEQSPVALLAVAVVLLFIPLVGETGVLGEPFWGLHALAAAILALRWARRGALVGLLASTSIYVLGHTGPIADLLPDAVWSTRRLVQGLSVHILIVGVVAWFALRLSQADTDSRWHAERARLAATIFNDAADPILTLDSSGLITMFNPAAEELTGHRASAVVGQHIFEIDVIAESAIARVAFDLTLLLDGQKPVPVEFELRRNDGAFRFAESHSRPIRDAGDHVVGVQMILRDITERREIERALRDSEDRQRAVLSSLDAGVIYQSIDSATTMNPAAERILGITVEQLRGDAPMTPGRMLIDSAGNPFRDEDHPAHLALRTGIVRTGVVMGVRHSDATTTWLLVNSRPIFHLDNETPIAAVSSFSDITELREHDERYRAAMESSLDPIQMLRAVRDRSGTIVDFEYQDINQPAEAFLRFTRKQAVGTRVSALFPAYVEQGYFARYVEVIETGQSIQEELADQTPGFEDTWIHQQITPISDGVAITSRDITQGKQAEAALRQSQQELSSLTDNAPDIIVRFDREYRRLFVNPAMELVTGQSRDEIIGTTLLESSPNPEYAALWVRAIDDVFATRQPHTFEFDYQSVTGQRWFQSHLVPEMTQDGVVTTVLATSRDITERRQAEVNLRHSQRELKTLTDNVPDNIARYNRQYQRTFVNPAFARAIGRPTEEIIGTTTRELSLNSSHADIWESAIDAVFEHGAPVVLELELPPPDGTFWHQIRLVPERDASGQIISVLGMGRDITEAREATIRLHESQEQFRSAFDDATIGMALVSTEGRFMQVNAALCAMLDYTPDELIVTDFQTITHADDLNADLEYVRQMLAGSLSTYQMEKRYIRKHGEIAWILLGVSLVRDSEGQPLYFISQIQDINERRRLQDELSHRAYHDPLTGLPNRGLFENRLEHALERTLRRSDHIAVMYLDLDGFKSVNDRLGHGAGDELLTEVGQRIRECVRGSDTVARLGGDEFTVLFEDVGDSMAVVRIADRIIKALAHPFDLDEGSASITTSIGLAFSHAEDGVREEPHQLLARADAALYDAKRRGKDRYVLAETPVSVTVP